MKQVKGLNLAMNRNLVNSIKTIINNVHICNNLMGEYYAHLYTQKMSPMEGYRIIFLTHNHFCIPTENIHVLNALNTWSRKTESTKKNITVCYIAQFSIWTS